MVSPLASVVSALEPMLALTPRTFLVGRHPSILAARLYLVYATQSDHEPIQALCELFSHEFEGLGNRGELPEEESSLCRCHFFMKGCSPSPPPLKNPKLCTTFRISAML